MSRQFAAFRGLAILLVVVNHSITLALESLQTAGQASPPGWQIMLLTIFKSSGLVAVPIFLFLSGSYVAYAVRGRDLASNYRTVALSLRFVIVPYLVWSVLFYVLIYLINHTHYSIFQYLRNLAVGYPFNFVPILIFFYVLGPILVRAAERWPVKFLLIWLTYELLTANAIKPGLLGMSFPDWSIYLTIPGLRNSIAIWGVFFPLGVVHSLHRERADSFLKKGEVVIALGALALYIAALTNALTAVRLPIGELLFPMVAILLLPMMTRDQIPMAHWLEWLGRMAYGLYLTNLTILSLCLIAVTVWVPFLFQATLILVPLLMALTIGVTAALFQIVSDSPLPKARRYLFG